MDTIGTLDHTFQHAHGVIAAVRADQFDDATPCTEWTVRALLEHTIAVVEGMGAAVRGEAPAPFTLASDPAAQFQAAAASTLAAWSSDGALDRIVDGGPGPMPGHVLAGINLLDTATHSWDLAIATGQPATLPDDVAVAALEASRMIISPEVRVGRFDDEVMTTNGADATSRLVAFLGRNP